jgi:DNA-binding HxlR family transcriptional regulator
MRKIVENLDCGITVAMKIFGGKWKPCIIDAIASGYTRPSEMARYISDAPQRVIEMQLRELELHGIVQKINYGGFPLKTEYILTEAGRSVLPVIDQLNSWGANNKELLSAYKQLERKDAHQPEHSSAYECFAKSGS